VLKTPPQTPAIPAVVGKAPDLTPNLAMVIAITLIANLPDLDL
jgi:hypothetical protein